MSERTQDPLLKALRGFMSTQRKAVMLVVCAVLFVPAVEAKIIEEKDGYVITSVDDSSSFPGFSLMSGATIAQGQTQSYSSIVPSGRTAFMPDLNWGAPSNSLSLLIIAPDSQLGPYYDGSDGVINGRIGLRISRAGGLTAGPWWSHVYGYSVSGWQSYSYSASTS